MGNMRLGFKAVWPRSSAGGRAFAKARRPRRPRSWRRCDQADLWLRPCPCAVRVLAPRRVHQFADDQRHRHAPRLRGLLEPCPLLRRHGDHQTLQSPVPRRHGSKHAGRGCAGTSARLGLVWAYTPESYCGLRMRREVSDNSSPRCRVATPTTTRSVIRKVPPCRAGPPCLPAAPSLSSPRWGLPHNGLNSSPCPHVGPLQ